MKTAFEQKLAKALRGFPAQERYLVGVSGGRDSAALLHGLVAAGYRRLVVCHLDHGLRGRAARGDATFVQRLAEGLGLTVEVGRVDVRALARTEKRSLEAAAREARYRFFASVAARRRCRTLLLAHQADDQAETFLFNLLRGAGSAGLAAMAAMSRRRVGRGELTMVRPLLAVWRTEIDEFLRENRLRWREDASNGEADHATRNRLRLEVLPQLEAAMGREVKGALWRAADLLGAEDAWLRELCAERWPVAGDVLSVEEMRGLPLAARRRVVRGWLRTRGVPDVGYRDVEGVLGLLEVVEGPAKVNLPGGRHARRRAGVLFVE